jgi:hypothetical protein
VCSSDLGKSGVRCLVGRAKGPDQDSLIASQFMLRRLVQINQGCAAVIEPEASNGKIEELYHTVPTVGKYHFELGHSSTQRQADCARSGTKIKHWRIREVGSPSREEEKTGEGKLVEHGRWCGVLGQANPVRGRREPAQEVTDHREALLLDGD